MHMVTKCSYCNSKLVLSKENEWVCTECGTVAGPLYVWPRRRFTRKEAALAILYGYA